MTDAVKPAGIAVAPESALGSLRALTPWIGAVAAFLVLPYVFTGGTAGTVAARVWDVAPDGTALLMTRGVYRVDAPAYDSPAGTIRLPLFGNHWPIKPGHRIRLDLQEADTPTFRLNNTANTFTFKNPKLVLPTRQSGDTTIAGSGG